MSWKPKGRERFYAYIPTPELSLPEATTFEFHVNVFFFSSINLILVEMLSLRYAVDSSECTIGERTCMDSIWHNLGLRLGLSLLSL